LAIVTPLAPTNLVATSTTTARVDLTWTDNSNNEASFVIERSEDFGTTFIEVATLAPDTQSYSDLGLLPGWPYFYQVSARNSAGSSSVAGPANTTTLDLVWTSFTGPGVLSDHSAVYDSQGKRMIVFGGQDGVNFLNELWILDLSSGVVNSGSWSSLPLAGAPSPRIGHTAVYDSTYNRMIVFGGMDDTAALQNDVHVLTLGPSPAWTTPSISGTPPSVRLGHTAIYEATHQQMVIFGGNDLTATSELADVRILSLPSGSNFTWTSPSLSGGPVKRTEHTAVYDELHQQMIVFGGLDNLTLPDGSVLSHDAWSLSFSGTPYWLFMPLPGPSFLMGHAAVYDGASQRMLIFGGDTVGGGPLTNEIWALRLDSPSWSILPLGSGTPPLPRYAHTAVYDSGLQRVILFGGTDDFGVATSETWISGL
jgi:hypothetical protein